MKSGMEKNVFVLRISSTLMENADHVVQIQDIMVKIVYAKGKIILEIEEDVKDVIKVARNAMELETKNVLNAKMVLN